MVVEDLASRIVVADYSEWTAGRLAMPWPSLRETTTCGALFDWFGSASTQPAVAIVDENNFVVALANRLQFLARYSQRYIHELYSRRPVAKMANCARSSHLREHLPRARLPDSLLPSCDRWREMKLIVPEFPQQGGCVCGAVRYCLTAAPLSLYACHCKRCQSYSGGAYSMSMPVLRQHFDLLQGTPKEFRDQADSGRTVSVFFCEHCGTRIWHAPAHSPDQINIKPGTLDNTTWIAPVAHLWTCRMQPGTRVQEGALCIEGQPATRDLLYEAWAKAIR